MVGKFHVFKDLGGSDYEAGNEFEGECMAMSLFLSS